MNPKIKSTRYISTYELREVTALGNIAVSQLKIDQVVVSIDVGLPDEHEIWFSFEAISNRMAGYGLATEEEAIEALVREHIFRMSPELTPADPTDRVQVNGGIDDRITVEWNDGAKEEVQPVLEPHTERIEEARIAFEMKFNPSDSLKVVEET